MLLRTLRRQFWQPYEKIFDSWPKNFRSRSEQIKLLEAFLSKYFRLIRLLVTRRNQFWQTWRYLFDKKRDFSDQFPEVTKKIPKKIISLNGSYKHVEWPFDNPGELFLQESKIFLSESPKVINKTLQLLQNLFNSKSSSGHEECSFDHPVDKFLTKSRRTFAQCPKMIGGKITADTSSQNDAIASWNAVPTTQSYNFRKKVETFPHRRNKKM